MSLYLFAHPFCLPEERRFRISDVGKYKNVMHHILKEPAWNLEWIFTRSMNTSDFNYHPLFETFQDEVLFLDAEMGPIPEDINLPGIDQLPAMIDGQVPGTRSLEDAAKLIHALAKLSVQNPEITLTRRN